MFTTTKELGAIKGISEQKVAKLKEIGGCWERVGLTSQPQLPGPVCNVNQPVLLPGSEPFSCQPLA